MIVAGGHRSVPWRPRQQPRLIPIVFSMGAIPVKIGLVTNLNRPGGNVTGVSHLINATWRRNGWSLLRELVPPQPLWAAR